MATRILRRATLSSAVLASVLGPVPPASYADAEVAPPENWSYKAVSEGVIQVGVPLAPPSFAAPAKVPAELELLFFSNALPEELTVDEVRALAPAARAVATPGEKPGVVPFEVSGLVPGDSYSAVVLGTFLDE